MHSPLRVIHGLILGTVPYQKILIAIPAWNEAGSIDTVVASVREHRPDADVLVVNDGSTDLTAQKAQNAGARVVTLPFNVGVGGAMRTAFLYAQREGYQVLVQVDADGQHDPADLDRLIEGLWDSDIVVGTRFHPRINVFRRWTQALGHGSAVKGPKLDE